MKGPGADVMRTAAKVKNMNPAQIYAWANLLYRLGYEEGLREGEKEFDDAIIMDLDEAIRRGINLEGIDIGSDEIQKATDEDD